MNGGDSSLVSQINNSQNRVVSNKDPHDKTAGKKSDPTAREESKQHKASRNHKSSKSQRKKG
jgi:hypothetical protein